ncbi:MAG: (d)CMP kinase [Flavobacteriales bacterium]|nr:(d)CMP kinase [Flavobacteriales bacterium]
MIIAIDGFSSTGKSSVARELAKHFNITHIDSGAMYRAITLYGIRNFYDPISKTINTKQLIQNLNQIILKFEYNPNTSTNEIFIGEENVEKEIRTHIVSQNVSVIAQLPEVRNYLVKQQQMLGKTGDVIMDGRDIGTVVFPNATFKFFITASEQERVNRRYLEISPTNLTREQIKENLRQRDKHDVEREDSPLKKADDAILIDNSSLNKQQTIDLIIDYIEKNNSF